jgi:hypothetical protein
VNRLNGNNEHCSSIIDYQQMCLLYNLPTLSERRETVCRRFYEKSVIRSTSCLHYLLPSCRENNIVAKLRSASFMQFLPFELTYFEILFLCTRGQLLVLAFLRFLRLFKVQSMF